MTDRLETALTNEPRFQQVVEQVTEVIASDAELGAMVNELDGRGEAMKQRCHAAGR